MFKFAALCLLAFTVAGCSGGSRQQFSAYQSPPVHTTVVDDDEPVRYYQPRPVFNVPPHVRPRWYRAPTHHHRPHRHYYGPYGTTY